MKLPAFLKNLNKRERYGVILAAGVIGIFLFAIFIVQPFLGRTDKMKKKTFRPKRLCWKQMQKLQSEYAALTQSEKTSKSRFRRRPKGFKLYSFLDRLAGKSGIKDRIIYMKPSKKSTKKIAPIKSPGWK